MATIVTTQYRENYGAHAWDGEGECPQYWKNKGGETYVVRNASEEQLAEIINYSSQYSEEYVMHTEPMDPSVCPFLDWETRRYITRNEDGTLHVEHTSGDEIRSGLKSWKHTWEYPTPAARIAGECSSFSVEYVFEDGHVSNSEEDASAHFETLNQN